MFETYKSRINQKVMDNYADALSSFDDLIGTGHKEMSAMFYLLNRFQLYCLSNDASVAISEEFIARRRKIFKLIRLLGANMLACSQVIENRDYLNDPQNETATTEVPQLPDKPVIIVANHGFRDDVLATVLAANRHGVKLCGSLPMFYNTFNGFASSLIGDIVVNRRIKESRRASIEKAKRVLELGADLILFPEGGWNKSSEKITLELWGGVYDISKATGCDVVPIVHYNREAEILDKKNVIHTVVDDPIPLYEMEKTEALLYLRDVLSSWQYKMAEIYGRSTREKELNGYADSNEKWRVHLTERMKVVDYYDAEIEKNSEYRPKTVIRAEDVFRPIANIQNISAQNIKSVLHAKELVKTIEESDWQKLF